MDRGFPCAYCLSEIERAAPERTKPLSNQLSEEIPENIQIALYYTCARGCGPTYLEFDEVGNGRYLSDVAEEELSFEKIEKDNPSLKKQNELIKEAAKNDRGFPCRYDYSEINVKSVEKILGINQHEKENDMNQEPNGVNEAAAQAPLFNYQLTLNCLFTDIPDLDSLSSDDLLDTFLNKLSSLRGNSELIRKIFSYRIINNAGFVSDQESDKANKVLLAEIQELKSMIRKHDIEISNLRRQQIPSRTY